jgi:hypothetical protein
VFIEEFPKELIATTCVPLRFFRRSATAGRQSPLNHRETRVLGYKPDGCFWFTERAGKPREPAQVVISAGFGEHVGGPPNEFIAELRIHYALVP